MAELQYGKLPDLERQLKGSQEEGKDGASTNRLLRR